MEEALELSTCEGLDVDAFDAAAAGDEEAAVRVWEVLVSGHSLHPL